jgi:glycosyltransferase involved in cell wall biosynthesis
VSAASPGGETNIVRRLPPIKAALVHDWFAGMYGSERVVEAMRTGLFDPSTPPDVFTFHAAHEVLPEGLNQAIVAESRLPALPGLRQRGRGQGHFRYLLPYMPRYFRHLDLDAYDLVIVSSHACAINARPRADAAYVCYSHTPMRYIWMPELESERLVGLKGAGVRLAGRHLRRLDRQAAQRPDLFVANSTAVKERVRRFYGRDAEVVPPPVDVAGLDREVPKDPGHFLWVHRLIDYKQPEMVMESFRGLPYRLTMVGVGPLEERLRSRLPENVELRGWLAQEEPDDLYARSAGFIHVAEEDFGIAIVEALAAGSPVIALNQGGARDIVRPGTDGLLIEEPSVALLRDAIREVASRSWDRGALVERAQAFSRERFLARMSGLVSELLASQGSRTTRAQTSSG